MTLPVSHVIPYLCGLSRAKRRARKLIMAKVFIDDSGSSTEEPVMYVAGWVGQVETWDKFANEWEQTLAAANPKPIKYFKHYEARSLRGGFAGFTASEAQTKTAKLAELINRHSVYGVGYMVGRNHLQRMIQKHAVTIKGRAHRNLADPFFICLNSLIGFVLGSEYVGYPNDKVDFIFDGKPGSDQATRVLAMYEVCRDSLPAPYPAIMGTAMPMNDKDVLPLQAADLLVGQVRAAIQLQADPEPLALMRQHTPIHVGVVSDEVIASTISWHNMAVSTRRLLTIKREHDREIKG